MLWKVALQKIRLEVLWIRQDDYDRIIDLVWEPEAPRRDAACIFVSRFVLQEELTG